MLTEGIGIKPPQHVRVFMTLNELVVMQQEAIKRADHRAYRSRRDQWGAGIKTGINLPHIGDLSRDLRPIFAGCLGEYAVKSHLENRFHGRVEHDMRLLKYGDFGIDLSCFGLKMQVKTRQNEKPINLVRRTNNRGTVSTIPAHAFCFCEWQGSANVYLVGWCWSETVKSKPLVSSVGSWKNAEIPDSDLMPMCRLKDELEAWQEARQWR